MAPKPEKLKVDFLLNDEPEPPLKEDREKRKRQPPSASASPSPAELLAGLSSPQEKRPALTPAPPSRPNQQRGSQENSRRAHAGPSSQLKSYRCDLCGKEFVERGNLNKHISSVHRKEKTKVCPEPGCGKSFSFRDGLVRHIAHVHQNQRRHTCQICQKSFKQGSHLSKHMRSIHNQQ